MVNKRMKMKLIFLDIDGVLNNYYTKEEFSGFTGIDIRLRDMFLNWLKDRDYQIVLSSSWRIPSAYGDFLQHLRDNGLSWIGETPYLKGIGRGHEIQAYLISNPTEPSLYCILDDMGPSEFLKHQRPCLVQTSGIKGLEQKKLYAIDRVLQWTGGIDGK